MEQEMTNTAPASAATTIPLEDDEPAVEALTLSLEEEWKASTPEELRQASANWRAGRLETFSREEVRAAANAL
jgi:hypothetical protein